MKEFRDIEDIISGKSRNSREQREHERIKDELEKNKISNFETLYSRSLSLAKEQIEIENKKFKRNISVEDLAHDILYDRVKFKKASILEQDVLHGKESFYVERYKRRIENFMHNYSDQKVKFGRYSRDLSEWLERLEKGKIKIKTMNSIIKRFKDTAFYQIKKEGSE